MYVPAGTPKPIVERLSSTLEKVLKEQDVAVKLLGLGITPQYVPGPAHEKANIADIEAWRTVAREAGIKPQ
ncbi:hypothetical protein D3C87_1261020 [compost metagenome]